MDKFKNSMLSAVAMFREMDLKMIGIVAIIGVGIVLGLFMLMK